MIPRLAAACVFCVSSAFACGILGGPTKDTTTHPCDTGGSCPNGYDCPPYANPSGRCEAHEWFPSPSELAKRPDAGAGDAGR